MVPTSNLVVPVCFGFVLFVILCLDLLLPVLLVSSTPAASCTGSSRAAVSVWCPTVQTRPSVPARSTLDGPLGVSSRGQL